MRWASWLLGIVGILQYAVIVATGSSAYVSLDMSYLVMFLCVIAGVAMCYASCWGGCGYGGGCDCCGDGCECGDCADCTPHHGHEHGASGHEGHNH